MSALIQSLAESLGLTMSEANTMKGTINGINCTCVYRAAHRHGPETFTVSLPVRIQSEFTLRKEKGVDRFFRKIGLVRELTTGDPLFDREYYIDTYHEKFTSTYFSDASKRSKVEAIFALRPDVSSVAFKGGAVVITVSPCPPESLSAEQIYSLVVMGSEIGEAAEVIPESRENRSRMADKALIGFSVIFALTGYIAITAGTIMYETDDMSLAGYGILAGLAGFVLFLVPAYLAVRGRSSSLRVFTIIFFSWLIGFPCMGGGLPLLINGFWDSSAPVEYAVPITGSSKSTGGRSAYYVHAQHWRDKNEITWLSVDSDTYENVRAGDTLYVYVKPGALGFERIDYIRIGEGKSGEGK